jgi:hypothetical protein
MPRRSLANSSARSVSRANDPWDTTGTNRAFQVSQVELIDTFQGSSLEISTLRIDIQPGNKQFPWLSGIADKYQRYRFRKLRFFFKPSVSDFSSAGKAGRVGIGYDRDSSDPVPITARGLENMQPHVVGMPYQDISLTLPPMVEEKYIRQGNPVGGESLNIYDAGWVVFFNFGLDTSVEINTVLGEMFVEYVVDLIGPVYHDPSATGQALTRNYTVTQYQLDRRSLPPVSIQQNGVFDLTSIAGWSLDWFALALPSDSTTADDPIGVRLIDQGWTIPPGQYLIYVRYDLVPMSDASALISHQCLLKGSLLGSPPPNPHASFILDEKVYSGASVKVMTVQGSVFVRIPNTEDSINFSVLADFVGQYTIAFGHVTIVVV